MDLLVGEISVALMRWSLPQEILYGSQKISGAERSVRLITRERDGYVAVIAPRDEPIDHQRDDFLECV